VAQIVAKRFKKCEKIVAKRYKKCEKNCGKTFQKNVKKIVSKNVAKQSGTQESG
jgi:hypothetical protein